jgi:Cu-processing system permease protein
MRRMRLIGVIAAREWRAALAARWFWSYGAVLAALGAGLLWMASGMLPGGISGEMASGRMVMATVNLLALLVPLMGLTAGAQSLARERDRGTLAYLLAQPVTRAEVLLGKLVGNGLALGAALGGATLIHTLASWVLAVPLPAVTLAEVAGLGWLLALAAMGLGALLGAGSGGLVATQGVTIAAWLVMILLGDLGLMGFVMFGQLPAKLLLVLTLINPVHQFRVAAVALFRPTLEALGPVGLYAQARLGGALVPVLIFTSAVWTLGVVLAALERFRTSRVLS